MTDTTTTWSPDIYEDYDALKGLTVVSADGERLGTIEAILRPKQPRPQARGRHYVLVTLGMRTRCFGQASEIYIPESAIANVSTDAVRLTYATDQLEAQGWEQAPANPQDFHRA